MKRLAAVLALLLVPATALAWEPETTHAGLAEQAALASKLHKRLVLLGFSGGLFEPLTIPPADAPALVDALHLLSPTHGSVPDSRGRQAALAWLTAGAALADVPAANGANHFYDPATRGGWRAPDRGVGDRIADTWRGWFGRAGVPDKGVPAPDWVTAQANPFSVEQFYNQYAKAVSAATPGERSRYMAAALVAAGATLHTLGDLGAPSRVRGDEAAHLEPLGGGPDDLGSRFERIAALAFGRLGVPGPSRVVTRDHLRDYFSSAKGDGLADEISRSFFSPNTLPEPSRVSKEEKPHLARALPALPARLNVMAASRDDGTVLHAPPLGQFGGVCLARYRVEHDTLAFSIDDDCMLEQVSAILPEVAAYETGVLDFLLRGELTITAGDALVVSAKGLAAGGQLALYVEDERGVRAPLAPPSSTGAGEELAKLPIPSSGTRVVAVFRGTDAAGEPIVAVGALALSH